MLIEQGRVLELNGKPWAAVLLSSDSRLEEVTFHIGRWARKHFHDEPFQLLFPVQGRDVNGLEILTPYLLTRSKNLQRLTEMRSIYGVKGVELDQYGRVMEIDNEFVQRIREQAEQVFKSWSDGISTGSFVRILFGSERMLCGTVERILGSRADVRISLRSRDVIVRTPVRSLLNLGNVPEKDRQYFYVPGLLKC